MRKSSLYIIIGVSLVGSVSYAGATSIYDAQVTNLANSIFTQIQNDVPPPPAEEETGSALSGSYQYLANEYVETIFTKNSTDFQLTAKALNARLNGGLLVKDEQDAVDFMFEKNLTKYNTLDAFQADSSLRRDEAAKFFSLFAKQAVNRAEETSRTCDFKDLSEGHTDLQTNVISACKMGIFKGTNGMFNPTKSLTNGEALAVLIRIVYGPMDETNTDHRAKNYRQKAQTYGLTQGSLLDSMKYLDKPITRGDMGRLLEAARFIPTIKLNLGGDISYSTTAQGYVLVK